jgi:hypothetical protein
VIELDGNGEGPDMQVLACTVCAALVHLAQASVPRNAWCQECADVYAGAS